MAFFGTPNSFLGIDIGTSSLKLVEIVDRKKRVELVTYAQANIPNLLVGPKETSDAAISKVANVISQMMDKAGVSTDIVVAALPSSTVFSSLLTMPDLPDQEMDKAVRFSARDVVPSDLNEMVLGWSKVAREPHMETDVLTTSVAAGAQGAGPGISVGGEKIPVFLTAAPKAVVDRYIRVMDVLHLKIFALEVETFPLVRSLLASPQDSALLVDIGDRATTYHIIDRGTPRVSHTIEYGGYDISEKIAQAVGVSHEEGEQHKVEFGLGEAPENITNAITAAVDVQAQKAKSLLALYQQKEGRAVSRTILIGGGANLKGLTAAWSAALGHNVSIGNPWKGLSYQQSLEAKLVELGPTFGVAVGLAMRGLQSS
ncbi:MAG: pilus assembly protein PilM [Candidatus Andersenbacteria bacterium]|nr:pilus assembly protein PilM [Candidatus Andersenbacteria bacterium]